MFFSKTPHHPIQPKNGWPKIFMIMSVPTCGSPDINQMEYYVWGVVERDSNRQPHNTVGALRAAVVDAMANIPKTHLITACRRFRQRVEDIIVADGGFIK